MDKFPTLVELQEALGAFEVMLQGKLNILSKYACTREAYDTGMAFLLKVQATRSNLSKE